MAWLPAVATIAASIFASEGQKETNDTNLEIQQNNSAFNAEQAHLNRVFQDQQADDQRAFQQANSDTVWQRGVRDMQSAGLNPMLAYSQGGNPAPAGAAGSGSQASAGSPGNAVNPYAAAGASAGQWAQIENVQAQTSKTKAEEDLVRAQIPKTQQDEEVARSNAVLLKNLAVKAMYDTDLSAAQKKKVEAEVDEVIAKTKNLDADTRLKKVNEVLQAHDIPRMKAESDYFKSPVGKTSPHNKYGPQTPFRLLEGLGERLINKGSAWSFETPDVGQKYHPSGRIR